MQLNTVTPDTGLFSSPSPAPARSGLFQPIAAPLKRASSPVRVTARQAAAAYARMLNEGDSSAFLPLLDGHCEFVTRDQTWTGFGPVADRLHALLKSSAKGLPRQQAVGTVHVGAGRAVACSFQYQPQHGASYRVTTFRIRDGRVVGIFEQASDPSWYRVQGSHLYPRRPQQSRKPALSCAQLSLGFGPAVLQ